MIVIPVAVFSALLLLLVSEFKKKPAPKSAEQELGDAIAKYLKTMKPDEKK